MQSLSQLFFEATGKRAAEQNALTASGSNRRYYRLVSEDGQTSLIGVQGTSRDENHAFIYMAEHFLKQGLSVPRVVAVSDDEMCYLQEDLGNTLLFDYIAEGRKTGVFSAAEKEMLRKTVRGLAKFQVVAAKGFDFKQCYPQPEFNLRSIQWDLNYFKYCFLKATGLDFQEDRLENEFERLAYILLRSEYSAFMYRDFQSRNVMIVKNAEGFIYIVTGAETNREDVQNAVRIIRETDPQMPCIIGCGVADAAPIETFCEEADGAVLDYELVYIMNEYPVGAKRHITAYVEHIDKLLNS